MARLTAAERRQIPKSRYGVPSKAPGSGSYPMPDRTHAAVAESLAAKNASPKVKAQVDRKAHELYPDLGQRSHSGHTEHLQSQMHAISRRRHGHHA